MNFDPTLSPTGAALLTLFAASMWGTWFISLKHLGRYPLDAFLLTLLTVSVVFVWSVGFVFDGGALLGNIADTLATRPERVYLTLLCGIGYIVGMRFSLAVVNTIGLSLAQPVQSSINIFVGTGIGMTVGGIPEGTSPLRIMLAASLLFAAVLMGIQSGRYRVKSSRNMAADDAAPAGTPHQMSDLWHGVLLALLASAFIPCYSFALSFGLRSTTQANGLAVLPFMALLATGAFIGGWLTCGVNLTRKRQWRCIREAGFDIHRWGIMSGLFHYGGNIIQAFATAQISSAISWPLGMTSGLWTQMWGLVYGEFKGAPRMAYVTLALAIILYVTGAALLANMT